MSRWKVKSGDRETERRRNSGGEDGAFEKKRSDYSAVVFGCRNDR